MALPDLPNEILEKILDQVSFDDLFNLELVNKRLLKVVSDFAWPKKNTFNYESLVKYTDYPFIKPVQVYDKNIIKHDLTDKSVATILSRSKNLKLLDLAYYFKKISSQVCFELYNVPQLVSLNLCEIGLTKNDLMMIAKFCPLLKSLCLEVCFEGAEGYLSEECDEGLNEIFKKCSKIKYLNIGGNSELTFDISFPNLPNQLQYLIIPCCDKISHKARNHLISKAAKNIELLVLEYTEEVFNFSGWLSNFSKLKFLDISNMYREIVDFSSLNELEMLSVEFYDDFMNWRTLLPLNYCQKLKSLEIKFNDNPNFNLFEIFKGTKTLKYFHLESCQKIDHLIDFVQECQLEYLSISYCETITDEIINSLLLNCISLTHLELTPRKDINHKAIEEALKEKNPQRQNVLKLVIKKSPFELPPCKWCEVIQIEKYISRVSRVFEHFTDIRAQFGNQNSIGQK